MTESENCGQSSAQSNVCTPLTQCVDLNNGHKMPVIGFGTFRVTGWSNVYRCIEAALKAGYRSFDTAAVYNNEADIGFSLKELLPRFDLTRENIFLTTKLSPSDLHHDRVAAAVKTSCKNLQTSYLDLYLIHWPGASGLPGQSPVNVGLRTAAWRVMVDLHRKGTLQSIGVSNFTIDHLKELMASDTDVIPAVNQVEIHPHFRQTELIEFCRMHKIAVQAYCSLGGSGIDSLLSDPTVLRVSHKLDRTPAQVLLKWALQEELLIIPKSLSPGRIESNAKLDFIIPVHDMDLLNSLPTKKKYAWDPTTIIDMTDFADKIAGACYDKYMQLPKKGKPNERDWTLLAGVVKVEGWSGAQACHKEPTVQVVSLGTGSKCIGRTGLSSTGDILNDSHAEVMARRGFLRYLYYQMQLQCSGQSEIFQGVTGGLFHLRPDVTFHFFMSHTPCGDASIFPKAVVYEEGVGDCLQLAFPSCSSCDEHDKTGESGVGESSTISNLKRKCDAAESSSSDAKHRRQSGQEGKDIHRTGAKCLSTEARQDARLPGEGYHVLGAVRTKPGRGDPTLSVSCSDKLARWWAVGVQGALLALLLPGPVRLHSLTVAAGCPFSPQALQRAVSGRLQPQLLEVPLKGPYAPPAGSPLLLQATLPFAHARTEQNRSAPCPSSVVWCQVAHRALEVAVAGKRQGVTKKSMHTAAARLSICKRDLFRDFFNTIFLMKQQGVSLPVPLAAYAEREEECLQETYGEWKSRARRYQGAWAAVRTAAFPAWQPKPASLLTFKACEEK